MTPWSSASSTRIIAPGSSSSTVVPAPGAERTSSVPSACTTMPSSSVSPTWPSRAAPLARVRGEAAPVVADDQARHAGGGRVTVDAHRWGGRGPGRCASPRAPPGRRARRSRSPLAVRCPRRAADVAMPLACQRAEQVAQRGPQPADSRLGGWISTSSVRRSRTPWRSVPVAARSAGGARRRAAARSAASGARPNATPARSCTTPSCRSAAIRRRSWSEASIALASSRLALAVPALQAARHRPRERHLEEQEHDQPAEQRRRERAQQPLPLALTELKRW